MKKEFVIVTMTKAKFNRLSKAEQRVVIAKDVIDRIKLGQVEAGRSYFLRTEQLFAEVCLVEPKKQCEACAKGNLFLSFIGITEDEKCFNTSSLSGDGEDIKSPEMRKLQKIFTAPQLAMIETAFEGTYYNWNSELPYSKRKKCYDFFAIHKKDNARLIAICQNIIKNKGTFVI